MANIHDYLFWRGDLPLSDFPLNELDGLVLTRFAYMPFEEFSWKDGETVGALCKKLKKLPEEAFRLERDPKFVRLLEGADRFNALPVTDFVKDNDEARVIQFAAVCVHLSEDARYIAYCGTDSTLLGWKEDFYMSFMEDVPAQCAALDYANRIAKQYPDTKLYIGGHSKGGNLAVYAAVNLPAEVKERLVHVSDYDGPGFPRSYIESHDFSSVLDKLHTFLPQESMIGRIHEHEEGFTVVESEESGLNQHNVYFWQIRPNDLKRLDQPAETSEVAFRTIQNILKNTTPEERHRYVDTAFDLLMVKNVVEMKDLGNNLALVGTNVLRTLSRMPSEEWGEVQDVNAAMVKAYVEANRQVRVEEKLPSLSDLVDRLPIPDTLQDSLPELPAFLKN